MLVKQPEYELWELVNMGEKIRTRGYSNILPLQTTLEQKILTFWQLERQTKMETGEGHVHQRSQANSEPTK